MSETWKALPFAYSFTSHLTPGVSSTGSTFWRGTRLHVAFKMGTNCVSGRFRRNIMLSDRRITGVQEALREKHRSPREEERLGELGSRNQPDLHRSLVSSLKAFEWIQQKSENPLSPGFPIPRLVHCLISGYTTQHHSTRACHLSWASVLPLVRWEYALLCRRVHYGLCCSDL